MKLFSFLNAPRREIHSTALLPSRVLFGFLIAVLAVALITVFSYSSLQNRAITAERVTHTVEIMDQLGTVLSTLKDAETGQRGFLLTGAEQYLEPYTNAKAGLNEEFKRLHNLIAEDSQQQLPLGTLEQLAAQKMEELGETIVLRRAGDAAGALAVVKTDRGKAAMDHIRTLVSKMENDERVALVSRQAEWQNSAIFSSYVTWGSSFLLLFLIAVAAFMSSRDYRAREAELWIKAGQMGISGRLQGEQRIDLLGNSLLEFLAKYMNAQIGTVHVVDNKGRFQRVASHALTLQSAEVQQSEGGLLGQAVKENRALHIRNLPEGYLPIGSSIGMAGPRELVVVPASVDDVVCAVIELGFFREILPADMELLARISQILGIAIRSSNDRTKLEALLEETQRQAEELQTQQEELRVNNEELEEQGHVLKESQSQLEAQQNELQIINLRLEEQAFILQSQKDELSRSQVVLAEKASELERTNQYKSEFLANMSHELRTPLNSTLILAKLLADNKHNNLTEEQVNFAQTISSAGNDLLILINDILDLSKIEAGKLEINTELMPVAGTVDGLAKSLQTIAQQKGLGFNVFIESGTPEKMETDVQRFGQIIRNLLSNAIKFTEEGAISIRVSASGDDAIAFAVTDTGIGIASHQQTIIFEAFRQADGTTHRKYGGTGLGLSISRDLARRLGGDITVHSAPGEGSTFILTLPVKNAVKQVSPIAISEARTLNLTQTTPHFAQHRDLSAQGKTALAPPVLEDDRENLVPGAKLILIVEDDPHFAAILRDLAHEMGFQCIIAASASDGVVAAITRTPSAIVLDMNLPDHSGLSVLDQLKHNPLTRHIPVHVASVADYSRIARERGAVGYALKPVKREELVEAFQRLEAKFSQSVRRVLVVEDDDRQRESIVLLLSNGDVQITSVANASNALTSMSEITFDCMVMDLNLPDMSGYELLEKMAAQEEVSFPPVIVYTGRSLTRSEEDNLQRFSKSIIIKDARSPERLLDEVTLFLHQIESTLPAESRRMLKIARDRESAFEGRRILIVEDDVRNIFALTSVFESKGAILKTARNGQEALNALEHSMESSEDTIDLVLMDIMMPEMDGFTAMREIRKRTQWQKLPIIALTAKAMKDDQEKCLAAGANDYIAKPLDVEKLLSLARVWIPKRGRESA